MLVKRFKAWFYRKLRRMFGPNLFLIDGGKKDSGPYNGDKDE